MRNRHIQDALFSIIETFLKHIVDIRNLEEGWADAMSAFFACIEHHVGKHMMVRSTRTTDTASVPTSFLDELDTLRKTVEDLNEDKERLEERLNDKTALGNTLRTLPASKGDTASPAETGGQTGVIQRLVQKEKEVLRLQAEIATLSASKGKVEDAEAAKRERVEKNRQWANLMEEIAKNKAHIAEQEVQLEAKDKETKYLKRALESVYTRFQATMEENATPPSPAHARDATMTTVDAEMMASRSIASLAERDEEVKQLKEELASLRAAAMTRENAVRIKKSSPLADHVMQPPDSVEDARVVIASQPAIQASSAVAFPPPPPSPPPPPLSVLPAISAQKPPAFDVQSMASFAANVRIARPAPKAPSMNAAAPSVGAQTQPNASSAPLPPPPPPPPPPLSSASAYSNITPTSRPAGGPPPPPPPPPPGAVVKSPATSTNAPPPPPPAAFGNPPPAPAIRLQRKATQTVPTKKLKPFFWQKIATRTAENTIWSSIDTGDVELDNEELEKAFATDNKQVAKPAASSHKPKVTSLLPIARAQNIAIMLARMRLTHEAIRDAILQVDDKKMTTDRLKAIKSFVPSADEIKALSNYSGDFAALTASDQYFRTVSHIGWHSKRS